MGSHSGSRPGGREFLRRILQTTLVATAITDKEDMLETIGLQAVGLVFHKGFKGFLTNLNGTWRL